MIPVILHRCFPGWEQIHGTYAEPGHDGDIVLWADLRGYADAEDAKTIIAYLQRDVSDDERPDAAQEGDDGSQ